ncbi:hypothetical protein D9M71_460010 [compost metagenome]
MEIGATWYRRVSRNLRSTSYSQAKPKPPWVCRQALAASHEAFAARYLAMLALPPAFLPASYSSQARQRIRSAASISMCASAMGNWMPWFWPIGRPNTTRSRA